MVAAVEVTLLGTGAADGWPNAFCRCASCAVPRGTGEIRSQSSALGDDVLLHWIAPGNDRITLTAVKAGQQLQVGAYLVTVRPDSDGTP
jgi:adenosylcobinamide kinase/adenosylcobinamide-phosphate guanylyltransferase